MYASLTFGILGIIIVAFEPATNIDSHFLQELLFKSFASSVFVILTSFALSVAGKYLVESNEAK